MLATGKGVFELTGYREADLIGRDVTEIVEADPNPVAVALEWGVRRLGQHVGLTTRAGIQKPVVADLFPALDDDGGLLVALTRLARARSGQEQPELEDGHRSVSTHCSHSGRRAMQTRRPCQISRCGKHAPVLARHELHQVALDLLRDPPASSGRAAATSRRTCVSTTIALRLAELGRDDVRRLARHAREARRARRRRAGRRRRTPRAASASSRGSPSSSGGRSPSRRCRARAPRPAPRDSPRAGGTSRTASRSRG